MIETAYGTVSTDENGTEVSAEFAQLYSWATRPGLVWPCSQLAKLDSISAKFDARGDLVDLTVAFDGLPAGPSPEDLGADELTAWSWDVLRAALPDHPAIGNTIVGPVAATPAAQLTTADLDAAIAREDHHGWGYAQRRYLDSAAQRSLDQAVVVVANELGLTADELFAWTDSKPGRWLCDAVYGRSEVATVDTVRGCLNRQVIDDLTSDDLKVADDEDVPPIRLNFSAQDACAIADALELLAGIDEGEHTNYDDLTRLARLVRDGIGDDTRCATCGAEIIADGEHGPVCANGHDGLPDDAEVA